MRMAIAAVTRVASHPHAQRSDNKHCVFMRGSRVSSVACGNNAIPPALASIRTITAHAVFYTYGVHT